MFHPLGHVCKILVMMPVNRAAIKHLIHPRVIVPKMLFNVLLLLCGPPGPPTIGIRGVTPWVTVTTTDMHVSPCPYIDHTIRWVMY